MIQATLDFDREEAAKERGIRLAAEKNGDLLSLARRIARIIAFEDGTVDIDRVRRRLEISGVRFEPGNWMGAVFKGNEWRATGRFVKASHEGGHNRLIRVWALV